MALHLIERMAVEEDGEGEAVVCLHGLGGSANTWTPLMPMLARHRVLRIELPGSARSHRVEGRLTIARLVEAVRSVCTRLRVPTAHWLGHSMGTIVCQHLAAAEPALVRSLALYGPLAAPPDGARAALQARADKARSGGLAGMHEIAQALVQASLSAHTREHQPVAVAFVRESLTRQDPDGYARSCEALAQAQSAPLESITAPVLLVTGQEDAVAPPQAVRMLAQRLGHGGVAQIHVLPRCGHWTPVERPQECTRAWQDFQATLRARG